MLPRLSLLASAIALVGTGTTYAQEDDIKLNNLVISASGFEQQISDAPASITSVSGEELSKRSYSDVSDAVKNIPGIYMSGGGNARDVSIRGMDSSYTMFLVDGRPVSAGRNVNSNGTDGGKQIGLPPASMIERVEVIRGPMSSLYGSEAMGGVVNIITKKPTEEWHGSVSAEYTKSDSRVNEDSNQMEANIGGGLIPGLLGLQLHGVQYQSEESKLQVDDVKSGESQPDTNRKQGGATLVLTPDDSNTFELGYTASRMDYSHSPGVSIPEDNEASSNTYEKDVYQLNHNGVYDAISFESYLQHDVSERVQDDTKKEKMTILNTQGTYLWGNHMVTFGGRYQYEDFTDETNGLIGLSDKASANATRWLGALYSEVEWSVLDSLNVTTGLRYNDDEYFGSEWTPRVYANWNFIPEFTLKAGVSTGYKQPSIPDVTEGFARGTGGPHSPAPHPRALIVGNPDLKPETSTSYELGFVYENFDNDLEAGVTLFHTDFKDKITEERFCDPGGDSEDPSSWSCDYHGNDYLFLSERKNVDKAHMQGIELAFSFNLAPELRLRSNYTYTRSEQRSGEFKGEPLNKQPKEMYNIGLDWQASDKTEVWLDSNIRSRTSDYQSRNAMEEGTPSYNFVDVGVNHQLTSQARLKAGIYNVADYKVTNENYGVVLEGRRYNVGITVDF